MITKRATASNQLIGFLIGSSLTLALLVFALSPLTLSAGASPPASVPAVAGQQQQELVISKSADTGSADDRTVFTNERITYTIVVDNRSPDPATNITVLDALPRDSLTDIRCSGCEKIVESRTIPEPTGGTIVVTITRRLSWTISSLAPGQVATRTFSGVVIAHDKTIENQAFVSYLQNGTNKSTSSNEVSTSARIRLENTGSASLSSVPAWYSSDLGGTISQDWGDFDHDGDLDLVLGSSAGTTVYRNDDGTLASFWDNDTLAYATRWADINGDDSLDLVAIGQSQNNDPTKPGTNYIYSLSGSRFLEMQTFTSTSQLVRVEPADIDSDGDIDLIGGTNSINADCPVRLYLNDAGTISFANSRCISKDATANIGPGDFDNDGDPDLALGIFPNEVRLFINEGGYFTNSVPIVASTSFLPYDFAWGDYDYDGYLDLAAGYPLERVVRIYHNDGGTGFDSPIIKRTSKFMTPLAVDWADIDGDGRIDLIVADSPPRVFKYDGGAFKPFAGIPSANVQGQLWSVRGIDKNNDGDIEVALSDRDDASIIFENFGAFLQRSITPVDSSPASSVAWGDANADGSLDVAFGAGASVLGFGTRLYYNDAGDYRPDNQDEIVGFGPHATAFGDANRDGLLDLVLGFGSNVGNQLFMAGTTSSPVWTSAPPHLPSHSVAWGDVDADGDLDLLIGNVGANRLYVNRNRDDGVDSNKLLDATPTWQSTGEDVTRSIAWANYDGDIYPDFAAGNTNAPTRVYRNTGENSFTIAWESPLISDTRSVAWGDYDGDGDPDLAVGNYGARNVLYQNNGGGFSQVWTSEDSRRTTSLAWGDWDNDGDLDLAVGNDGEPDQVISNLGSAPDSPQLYWVWTSNESYQTTDVAWGDYDGDGDLDLGISQRGIGTNGFYVNTYVMPSHLANDALTTLPLPNNPPYSVIPRPGTTRDAYGRSSGELLGLPTHPTVTIDYTVYDADAERDGPDTLETTFFEFSRNGGGAWEPATAAPSSPAPITQTTGAGAAGRFVWDAQADAAISDDARFRVRVVPKYRTGRAQRGTITAVSPPFRVRGTTCLWPAGAGIGIGWSGGTSRPQPGQQVNFIGTIREGTGVLTFTWDFDDGTAPVSGQIVRHTFDNDGVYEVTLTVMGKPCPETRPAAAERTVTVGTGIEPRLYLPLALKNGGGTLQGQGRSVSAATDTFSRLLREPAAVTGLGGANTEAGTLRLHWTPRPLDEWIQGYHVYRLDETASSAQIATVPADATSYTLDAGCGESYYVTAFNHNGESPASTSSYRTLPCQDGTP